RLAHHRRRRRGGITRLPLCRRRTTSCAMDDSRDEPKDGLKQNIEPDLDLADEEDDQTLPEAPDEAAEEFADHAPGSLGAGRAVIARFAKLAPTSPGVYRMIGAAGEVLYVGKAKSLKKRVIAYARPTGLDSRITRMIAATVAMEFVSTTTETEALL